MKQHVTVSRKAENRFQEATHRLRRTHHGWGELAVKERLLHRRERDQRRCYAAECLEYGYQP